MAITPCPQCGAQVQCGCPMRQPTLFDEAESDRQREIGIARASATRAELLDAAQRSARQICQERGEAYIDDVYRRLELLGYNTENLGPSAGGVFKRDEFIFTGRWVKSTRVSNHSRWVRIWRLRRPEDNGQ
jgi:hypothetical protein